MTEEEIIELEPEQPELQEPIWKKLFENIKIQIAIIVLTGFCIYFQSIGFDVLFFDDYFIVTNIEKTGGLKNVDQAFKLDALMSTDGIEFYRPVQSISFMLDYEFGGKNLQIYHVTNIIYHILTGIILLLLLIKLFGSNYKSFLLVLLFVVHPVFDHSVAWLPSRGDILLGLFSVASLLFYFNYRTSGKLAYLGLVWIFFGLAMFTKETAILLPAIYILFDIILKKQSILEDNNIIKIDRSTLKQWAIILLPMFIVIIIYFIFRAGVIKVKITENTFGFYPFIHNLRALPEFFGKFFFPINLQGIPKYSILNTLIGLILLSLFSGLIYIYRKKTTTYLSIFGMIWFLIFISVTMLYRHIHGDMAYDYLEHRIYMPSIGLMILTMSFLKDFKFNKSFFISFFAIFIIFCTYNTVNIQKYKDGESFFLNAAENNIQVPFIYNNLGNLKRLKKDFRSAEKYYQKAITMNPNYAEVYFNRGMMKYDYGDVVGGLKDLDSAIKFKNDYVLAIVQMASIRFQRGEYLECIAAYNKSIKADPKHFRSYINRAIAYGKIGEFDKGLKDFDKAFTIEPNNADGYNNRGVLKMEMLKFRDAKMDFEKAVSIQNNFPTAYKNLGIVNLNMGDRSAACYYLNLAFQMGEKSTGVLIEKYCQ